MLIHKKSLELEMGSQLLNQLGFRQIIHTLNSIRRLVDGETIHKCYLQSK